MFKRSIRNEPRAIIGINASVTAPDSRVVLGLTRDVSTKGFFILCDQPLPEGSACSIILNLDGVGGAVSV